MVKLDELLEGDIPILKVPKKVSRKGFAVVKEEEPFNVPIIPNIEHADLELWDPEDFTKYCRIKGKMVMVPLFDRGYGYMTRPIGGLELEEKIGGLPISVKDQ